MNLPKAIEILKLVHDNPPNGAIQDFIDAIKLGIEAAKDKQNRRITDYHHNQQLLPGETKVEKAGE